MNDLPDPWDDAEDERPEAFATITPLRYALWCVAEHGRLLSTERRESDELH
ncbi:MAG: hypothetical protein Q7P63_12280 [Verrucomicrobiota bacterium JB022]|nr:hypothetical protein [Verrucomicrobiota bacterium JB022]